MGLVCTQDKVEDQVGISLRISLESQSWDQLSGQLHVQMGEQLKFGLLDQFWDRLRGHSADQLWSQELDQS